MSAILGIDPGATGWLVALDSDGWAWDAPMPPTAYGLVGVLRSHDAPGLVLIERQHAMPLQGRGSTFRIGYLAGVIEGVVAALGDPYEWVRAQDWQRVMLRGEPKASGKALKLQYVAVAQRLWPQQEFVGPRGGILDGKAAAALIAEYGRRVIMGK